MKLKLFITVIVLSQSVFAQAIDSSTYVKLFLPDGCVNATVMLQNYSVDSVPIFNPSICSQSSAPFEFDLLASDQDYILSIIGHDTIHINYTMSSYSLIEDDVTLIEEGSIYQVADTVFSAGDTLINTITNIDSIGSHFFIEYTDLYIITPTAPTAPTDPSGGFTDSMYTELIFPDGCTNATIFLTYLNEDSVLSINPVQCSQSSTPFVLSELSLDQEFVLNIIANDTININYSLNLHSPSSTMNLEEGVIYQIFDSITTEGNTSINVFSNIDTIGPNIVVNYSDLFVVDSIIDSFPWGSSLPGCQACSDEVNNTLLQYLSDTEMLTSQVVLILEQIGIDISITDSDGTEFVPTVMDSFIIFSPFNLEDQYTIVIDQSEISLEWLILLSDGSTMSEGEIASIDSTINNGMFTINSTLSIVEENSWDNNFPGTSGLSFDMDSFSTEIQLVYELINSDSTNMVLVLENTEQNISVTNASGTVLEPTIYDEHFIVFGVIEDNQQYTIQVDENENLDIGWGLYLPITEEIVEDGVITSDGDVLNGMFTISFSLYLEENRVPLEVYNTTYFNLLGKEVKTPDQGLYIKVMQTNKGQIADKVYFRD